MFKRETLIKNLKTAVENIQSGTVLLPTTIKAIYIYGGYLRGKAKLKDLDVALEIYQNQVQEELWNDFKKRVCEDNEIRRYFMAADALGFTLPEFCDTPVAKILFFNWERTWLKCLSWSDVLYGPECEPDEGKVMRRMFCGKFKGLHVWLGPPPSENYIKVWSPDRPDIDKNLKEAEPYIEKILERELEKFEKQLKERKQSFEEALIEVKPLAKTLKIPLRTNIEAFERPHAEGESLKKIERVCENLRRTLDEYDDYTCVLKLLSKALKDFLKGRVFKEYNDNHRYTAEEYAVKGVLSERKRSELSERRAREILRNLGLPEERIVAIHHYNACEYRAFSSQEEKEKVLEYKSEAEHRAEYQRAANRPLRNRNYGARVIFDSDGNPEQLRLWCSVWLTEEDAELIENRLKGAGFSVKRHHHSSIKADIAVPLSGFEKPEDIEKIVREIFSKVKYGSV